MLSDEYKAARRSPDAFGRSTLEETVRVLRAEAPELAPLIELALNQPPIDKPRRHTGEEWTDFIRVSIGFSDAETIRDAFVSKEVEAVSSEGSTTALAGHYAGRADAWTNYLVWLEDNAA